jgi:hypothetical protein
MKTKPVTYRGYGTALARQGAIYTCSLPGGFTIMERIINTYIKPKYMNTYAYKRCYLTEQGNIFIVVPDQYPKAGLEPFLCLLSVKPGVLS